MNEGFSVFLWRKLLNDIVDKKNSADPYRLFHRIVKVKDINKLAELVPNPYKALKLPDYFSADILDVKWIPKKKSGKWVERETDYNKKFDSFKYL